MQKTTGLILLIHVLIYNGIYSQEQSSTIKVTSFSSRNYNEFSPVIYKSGIVYCSDRPSNSIIGYENDMGRLFTLYYSSIDVKSDKNDTRILSREITTGFNDGPVTFNRNGTLLYYSRNNYINSSLRNMTDTSNKLGIFSAELVNGYWTNFASFMHNNPQYSLTTPALTSDEQRIFFASDKPGGYGGMDLYYCDRDGNNWKSPVNMGPVVNTVKNESFPFADRYGKVFFSSDGHRGNGGKDIFYTTERNGEWLTLVHLDSSINSTADDFGLVMDSTSLNGFFSSNRFGTDDIFSFTPAPERFTSCDTLKKNNYCFTFYDERYQLFDTLQPIYQWDFGNGIIRKGTEVKHCFPGPGNYMVKLDITDKITGNIIAGQTTYNVQLSDAEQAYISSNNIGIANETITFDALKSNLKNAVITNYFWDVGEGFKPGVPVMDKTFEKSGEYNVYLGLLTSDTSTGMIRKTCVTKKIQIFNSSQEFTSPQTIMSEKCNSSLQIKIRLMDNLTKAQKTNIESAFNTINLCVGFNNYGIDTCSYPFLDCVLKMLKENPEINLEVMLNGNNGKKTDDSSSKIENYAQELSFYFKNKGMNITVQSTRNNFLIQMPVSSNNIDNLSFEGIVELMFMKK